MKNLSGRWKLVNEGSDYYPGLDNLTDAPLVLKLLGTTEVEFYRIEKRKTLEIEELHFTYVTKGVSMSRSYQIGVLNYENVVGNNVTLGIIQNCDELFYEFTLTRLGPKQGQTSRETFRLDAGTDRVTLTIELHTPEGSHLKMIKYLIRFDEKEKIDNVPFKHAINSMGWKLFEFWESSVLSNAQAKIIRAVKIKSQSLQTNTGTKVLETIWNDPEFDHLFQNNEFDWSSIAKSHGNKNSEAEEVVEFIVKVKINESNWFVAHRYREFDALRKFILSQNPYNTEFQQADVKFPGKIMGMFRKAAMDKRVEGLEGFTSFYLENARFCRQNSIDALCSFLQIPENMHRIAREKAAAEPPPPPPAPVVTAARPGANKPITTTVNASKPAEPPKQEKPKNILNMFSGNSNTNTAPQKKEPAAPAPAPTPAPTASSNTSAPATATNNTTTSTTSASPAKAVVQPPASVTSETQSTLVFDPVLSPAQSRLLKRLNQGLQVIKHGRQGNPHPRALQCDDEVQNLIVQGPDRYKKIPIDSIDGLRLGSEIDPITSPEAIARYNTEGAEAKAARRKSTIGKLLGGKDEVLFGTAILRRTCKPEDMPLCISLLMEDRTLDLQCANQEDLNFLYTNLKEIIKK